MYARAKDVKKIHLRIGVSPISPVISPNKRENMESSTPHIIPWELIALCLQNENSPAQAEELKMWREAAPENEACYQEAERLWLMTGKIGTDVRFDSRADWPIVAKQITPQVKQPRWRMTPMRWAAAIAILLTDAFLLRMRAFHRLDLGITMRKEKKWGTRIWRLGLYNAYGRRNPFYYYYNDVRDDNGRARTALMQFSLFPATPSISYGIEF